MESHIPSTLGRRVAGCREQRGLTQKQLAEKAGLSVTFVSEVENDKRTPGAATLRSLADALHTSLDYLVKGVGAPPSAPLVIPAALAAAADKAGWTLGVTRDLLETRRMIVARRSPSGANDDGTGAMSEEEWLEFYRHIFKPDAYGRTGA